MKTRLLLILVLATGLHAHAQQVAQVPLPPGPLVPKLGQFAKWTVTVTPQPVDKSGSDSSLGNEPGLAPAPKAIETFTKTDPLRLISRSDSKGQVSETWCLNGFEVIKSPEFKKPTLFGPSSSRFVNYLNSDFPELAWISEKNYLGTKTFNGRPCWVFQEGGVQPAAVKPVLRVFRMAALDTVTKLPVIFRDGFDQHAYRFDAPPTVPLVLPSEIKAAIQQEQQRLQLLARKPPAG